MEHHLIKRRLLYEAMRENIAPSQERRPRPVRRAERPWWVPLLAAVGVGGTVCLAVVFFSLLWLVTREQRAAATLASPVPAMVTTEAPVHTVLDPIRPPATFAAPRPIDRTVFPLAVKTILLDPGHGGHDAGAVAAAGMAEKEVTLDIGQRLRRLLEEAAFTVLMTREKDETVTLAQRASLAGSSGADVFVSVHVNALKTGRMRGVETYYHGPTDEPLLLQLASLENRESGYSLADFRRLLEGVYLGVKRDESRQLAETIQQELAGSLHQVNPALKNWGVKTAPFLVLVATDVPAVLVEVSCLSNPEEARLLTDPQYRQRVAGALFAGIRTYAAARNTPTRKAADS